jgi:hypothetical protein
MGFISLDDLISILGWKKRSKFNLGNVGRSRALMTKAGSRPAIRANNAEAKRSLFCGHDTVVEGQNYGIRQGRGAIFDLRIGFGFHLSAR